jgi:hypothetical protein
MYGEDVLISLFMDAKQFALKVTSFYQSIMKENPIDTLMVQP